MEGGEKQGLRLSEVSEQDSACLQAPGPLLSEPLFRDAQEKTWGLSKCPYSVSGGPVTVVPGSTSMAPAYKCCVIKRVFSKLRARIELAPAQSAGCQMTGPGSPISVHPHPYLPPPRGLQLWDEVQNVVCSQASPGAKYPMAQASLGQS